MNLSELTPKESKFSLRSAKREFTLNPINLTDEEWLKEHYTPESIYDAFMSMNMDEICRIAFRFMDNESKLFFKTKEVTFATEDGEELTERLGGVRLFRTMVSGMQEKGEIISALSDTFGSSRPEVKETKKKVSKKRTTKKKVAKKKKK